jgi:hypothetical protein
VTDNDYLVRNARIATGLVGRSFVSALRLTDVEPRQAPRLEWGPALVEMDDHRAYVFDCEESKSNIILFEMQSEGPLREAYRRLDVRPPIVTLAAADPLRFMLEAPIVSVEQISRPRSEDRFGGGWFEMAGLRLRFANAGAVCVGTHLTPVRIPSVAFLLPDEADPVLEYRALAPIT